MCLCAFFIFVSFVTWCCVSVVHKIEYTFSPTLLFFFSFDRIINHSAHSTHTDGRRAIIINSNRDKRVERKTSPRSVAMARAKSKSSNSVSHLIGRQFGNNVHNFRPNLFRERLGVAKNLYHTNLVSHFGCVNAIEFSNDGDLLVSGMCDDVRIDEWLPANSIRLMFRHEFNLFRPHFTGGDDQRVLLWKLEESMAGISQPRSMKNQHYSNIFCLAFNNDSTKIFSGGNDDAVIVHDAITYGFNLMFLLLLMVDYLLLFNRLFVRCFFFFCFFPLFWIVLQWRTVRCVFAYETSLQSFGGHNKRSYTFYGWRRWPGLGV